MAYWVKKSKIILPKYFNSLDKKTRVISRLIALLVIFFLIASIKIYYYRFSWVEYRDYGSYTNTGHSWDELYANLSHLLSDSIILAAIIVIVVHTLDYFTKDKNPTLICNACYNIKDFDNDLKCECGGKYIRKSDMDYYVNEEEYKVLNPSTNRFDKIYIRGTNYYKCLVELPTTIFCPGCLTKISLNSIEQKTRKFHCDRCRNDFNFNPPDEWVKDGVIKAEYKYDLGFIINGELNISSFDQHQIQNKFMLLDSYKHLSSLPSKIKCPHCQKNIKLYRQEILDRKFKCSDCKEFLDLSYIQ